MSGDDDLLDLLGRTFDAPPAEPSMAELATLHRAVASRRAARVHRRRWGPRTLGLFIGLGALTTTGTAFALEGGHLPEPVVSVARTIGLPVSKPAAPPTSGVPPVGPQPQPQPQPASEATTPTPAPAVRRSTPTTRPPVTSAPPTTAAVRDAGDDHGGNRGSSQASTTTSSVAPTTSTTRVDNSGPGSSGSGHDGDGDGGSSGSSDGGGGTDGGR